MLAGKEVSSLAEAIELEFHYEKRVRELRDRMRKFNDCRRDKIALVLDKAKRALSWAKAWVEYFASMPMKLDPDDSPEQSKAGVSKSSKQSGPKARRTIKPGRHIWGSRSVPRSNGPNDRQIFGDWYTDYHNSHHQRCLAIMG